MKYIDDDVEVLKLIKFIFGKRIENDVVMIDFILENDNKF